MKQIKPLISVCIPTYEMGGQGADFLRQSFSWLARQTFKNFEIVVSDNSDNNEIYNVCQKHIDLGLPIRYNNNPQKGMAVNTNESMKRAEGELIKILYQDDYLYSEDSLKEIVENFDDRTEWLATGCIHTIDGKNYFNPHYPTFNDLIYTGNNTIGSPSVVTLRNNNPLLFDENLSWLLDVDLYKRYYDKFGEPKLLDSLNVAIRQGEHQFTNILTDEIKSNEHDYLKKRYG